jgi:hypothetical protein
MEVIINNSVRAPRPISLPSACNRPKSIPHKIGCTALPLTPGNVSQYSKVSDSDLADLLALLPPASTSS